MRGETQCLKIPRTCGQTIIGLADKYGLRDKALTIKKEADSVCIPLVREPLGKEIAAIRSEAPDVQLAIGIFEKRQPVKKTLEDALADSLPLHSLAILPKALDMVGDIAIVEISPELKTQENLIGNAILQIHRNIKTVLAKAGTVGGTYRIREFTVIAGEPRTSTIYKEYGCQYMVDLAKTYFSPRLSNEHARVSSLVQKDETVVDLFAGIGPYSVLIAKQHPSTKVFALDINPAAVALLKKNIFLNRVQDNVFAFLGDSRTIVHEKLAGTATRVIMNLPESATGFIDVACEAIRPEGGVIHFYSFIRLPDTVDALRSRFVAAINRTGRRVEQFLLAKVVRETAPYEQQIVLDAAVA